MSDTSTQDGNRRRRRRGGRNRPNTGSSQGGSNSGFTRSSTPRAGVQQPTGFQKFLSVISFGLLGKQQSLPRPVVRTSATTGAAARNNDSNRRGGDSDRQPREAKPRREAPTVNPGDISTDRLYVGNLSYDATESDLFELFNGVGNVRNAEVVVNNRTQRSKGFAFVTMGSVEEARRAVQELSGKDFMGRPLQLSGAKPLAPGERSNASNEATENEG